jgi:hypothetical protein
MSLARWWTARKRRPQAEPAADNDVLTQPARSTATVTASLAPSGVAPSGDAAAAVTAPAEAAAAETVAEPPLAERHLRFFCWLVGLPGAGTGPSPCPVIGQMLEQLDMITASESLRAGLLPRAPHVVPQLMKTLRDEHYSSADVASRISKDAVLTAEVVRSASSVFERTEDGVEIDLARAVVMIGTQGLRRAIANVVLRPIFDARGDTLSARAATQIWKDADRKARLCAVLAGQAALDPFDGYLAGLLHNSGWTAALRAIDGLAEISVSAADLAYGDVVPQLLMRRDALFGAIVGPWNLSPQVDLLAAEIGAVGLDAAVSPLAVALRDADRLAALRALAAPGERGATSVPGWALLAKPVQDGYAGLTS